MLPYHIAVSMASYLLQVAEQEPLPVQRRQALALWQDFLRRYPDAPEAQLEISEFLASNITGLTDQDGDSEDWIEIAAKRAIEAPEGYETLRRERSGYRFKLFLPDEDGEGVSEPSGALPQGRFDGPGNGRVDADL